MRRITFLEADMQHIVFEIKKCSKGDFPQVAYKIHKATEDFVSGGALFYFFTICFTPFQISLITTTESAVSIIFPHIAIESGAVSKTAVPT